MANLEKTQTMSRQKSMSAPSAVSAAPTEKIAARAYEIWQESGCPEGCDVEHWYQAERELRGRSLR